MEADRAVFTSMIVTLGSTVAYDLTPVHAGGGGHLPSPRLLIGAGLTFTSLSIMADLAPELAKAFAATIAITALVFYGVPVADHYFNPTNQKGTP